MKRIPVALIMVMFLFLSGCATWGPHPPAVPFEIPFAVHKAGETVSTEMIIVENRNYFFTIDLYYKEDIEDIKRVKKLAGWQKSEPGIPILLALKIIGLDDAARTLHFGKDVFASKAGPMGGFGFDGSPGGHIAIIIKEMGLKPGRYWVSLKSLRDIPELAGTPAKFSVFYRIY